MKRGAIVTIADPAGPSSGSRPCLVIQAELFNDHHPAVTLCPITPHPSGDHLFRVPVGATQATGLPCDGEIQIDLVQALRRERIGAVIGFASPETLALVDDGLRRWLDL